MGFLDNSGDIILDAVLTDAGRKRLARGDGSFKIAKFALADDEINYGLYNYEHASGSAYYDLEILQTPVLEAFTNNGSSLKSKLITISKTNVLYLPVFKLNESAGVTAARNTVSGSYFLVAVDENTWNRLDTAGFKTGIIDGFTNNNNYDIVIDQGLDTTALASEIAINPEMQETQYIIQMDNRLGSLIATDGTSKSHSFVDDDNIATYYITQDTDSKFVTNLSPGDASSIVGRLGSRLKFRINASLELETSTYLFDQIGLSSYVKYHDNAYTHHVIDSIVRVQGATTGYSMELPIRYIKKV